MRGSSLPFLVLALACATSPKGDPAPSPRPAAATPKPRQPSSPQAVVTPRRTTSQVVVHPSSTHAKEAPRAPKEVLGPFPEGLSLHKAEDVSVPSDRDLRVAHAEGSNLHAIIYLHGMCGNSKGADPWIDLATKRGTVITVRANVPCPDRPGYKWPQEPEEIQSRIDAALAHVKGLRGGHLDTAQPTLMGYSQGAHRAEVLAAAFPDRYRHLVLGGPPTAAEPEHFKSTQAIAILGGELEDTTHMEEGYLALSGAGLNSRFFRLPKAHHGGYGPEGRRVMSEVFAWLDQAENH